METRIYNATLKIFSSIQTSPFYKTNVVIRIILLYVRDVKMYLAIIRS
nr:MAG TPA: hypothetical protein [Caudoviricetes sp.]